MANKEYFESGMSFVFDDQSVFLPERVPFLERFQHVKACDFVSLYHKKSRKILLFIEAKSSAPYQPEPLKSYLNSIYSQFWHSLFFYISLVFDRHENAAAGLPDKLKQKQNLKKPIMCVLVVRSHKKEWLQPLQEGLRKEMLSMKKVFAQLDIVVTNEQGARKYGLVR
ncbi:hypothetical protein [Desulfonatronovibrio magnus]|uniref:hypothetical protein n=1 Tax=Desulfonatronovibrio magnus TaxID=698827 RepID=UPI0005EBD638|nr:hypothetical protein [Desulfonatronovibrio magnus]